MLKTALLFQNHMILQCDKKIAVWGTADAGERVTVNMQGKTTDAVVDTNGIWKAMCGLFEVSFLEEMVISSGEEKLALQDIQVVKCGWQAGSPTWSSICGMMQIC